LLALLLAAFTGCQKTTSLADYTGPAAVNDEAITVGEFQKVMEQILRILQLLKIRSAQDPQA
jgi:hypothetical protein